MKVIMVDCMIDEGMK